METVIQTVKFYPYPSANTWSVLCVSNSASSLNILHTSESRCPAKFLTMTDSRDMRCAPFKQFSTVGHVQMVPSLCYWRCWDGAYLQPLWWSHRVRLRKWRSWNPIYLLTLTYFTGGWDGKKSTCNAGDMNLIPGLEDPLKKGVASHSNILAWRTPWTEEPGKL